MGLEHSPDQDVIRDESKRWWTEGEEFSNDIDLRLTAEALLKAKGMDPEQFILRLHQLDPRFGVMEIRPALSWSLLMMGSSPRLKELRAVMISVLQKMQEERIEQGLTGQYPVGALRKAPKDATKKREVEEGRAKEDELEAALQAAMRAEVEKARALRMASRPADTKGAVPPTDRFPIDRDGTISHTSGPDRTVSRTGLGFLGPTRRQREMSSPSDASSGTRQRIQGVVSGDRGSDPGTGRIAPDDLTGILNRARQVAVTDSGRIRNKDWNDARAADEVKQRPGQLGGQGNTDSKVG